MSSAALEKRVDPMHFPWLRPHTKLQHSAGNHADRGCEFMSALPQDAARQSIRTTCFVGIQVLQHLMTHLRRMSNNFRRLPGNCFNSSLPCCSGNALLLAKVFINTLALSDGVWCHVFSTRSGGIEDVRHCLFKSSRLNFHHLFESRGKAARVDRNFFT